jgi:hypothetical protein
MIRGRRHRTTAAPVREFTWAPGTVSPAKEGS